MFWHALRDSRMTCRRSAENRCTVSSPLVPCLCMPCFFSLVNPNVGLEDQLSFRGSSRRSPMHFSRLMRFSGSSHLRQSVPGTGKDVAQSSRPVGVPDGLCPLKRRQQGWSSLTWCTTFADGLKVLARELVRGLNEPHLQVCIGDTSLRVCGTGGCGMHRGRVHHTIAWIVMPCWRVTPGTAIKLNRS